MQHFFPLWLLLLCVLTCLREENSALLPIIHSAWHRQSLKSGTGMNINSVVFPQKLLISQGQVSLRWFIKTRHPSPPLLSRSAFCHHSDRWTECVIKGATKILERSEDKKAEGPWRWCNCFPVFWAREPGQTETSGKGLGAGTLIPLSPAPRSQASQAPLATARMELKHRTTVVPRLGSTGVTVLSLCLVMGDDGDSHWSPESPTHGYTSSRHLPDLPWCRLCCSGIFEVKRL